MRRFDQGQPSITETQGVSITHIFGFSWQISLRTGGWKSKDVWKVSNPPWLQTRAFPMKPSGFMLPGVSFVLNERLCVLRAWLCVELCVSALRPQMEKLWRRKMGDEGEKDHYLDHFVLVGKSTLASTCIFICLLAIIIILPIHKCYLRR